MASILSKSILINDQTKISRKFRFWLSSIRILTELFSHLNLKNLNIDGGLLFSGYSFIRRHRNYFVGVFCQYLCKKILCSGLFILCREQLIVMVHKMQQVKESQPALCQLRKVNVNLTRKWSHNNSQSKISANTTVESHAIYLFKKISTKTLCRIFLVTDSLDNINFWLGLLPGFQQHCWQPCHQTPVQTEMNGGKNVHFAFAFRRQFDYMINRQIWLQNNLLKKTRANLNMSKPADYNQKKYCEQYKSKLDLSRV